MPTAVLPAPPGEMEVSEPAKVGSGALPVFEAGDIILFAAKSGLYGRVGGWLMRTRGEGPTYAVHTAQFLDAGRYLELDIVGKIRATGDILKKRQGRDMWTRRGFEVWRKPSLTAAEQEAVTGQALTYLGAKFGSAKFFTHLLDGLISKAAGRDVFLFRRLNHDQRYPICSWITAFSYDRALHYRFGVEPECADPDAIADWLIAHPGEWVRVFRLEDYS